MINKVKLLATGFVIASLVTLSGCLQTEDVADPIVQLNAEVNAIDNYLTANAGTITGEVIEDPSGLRFVIDQMGTELPARSISSAVNVKYMGYLFNPSVASGLGSKFDQGTWTNSLTSVIDGWKIAFTKLPIGTKGKVFIPSYWGYGVNGSGSIPGNTTLVFDIEYVNVTISDSEFTTWKADTTAIETYLATKDILDYDTVEFMSETTVDAKKNIGVRYTVSQAGIGGKPSWFDWIKIKTKYYLLTNDVTVVYQNDNQTIRPVDMLPGLNASLQQLNMGAKAKFYIPSGWAFGTKGYVDPNTGATLFPANANIIVEVEMVDFSTAP